MEHEAPRRLWLTRQPSGSARGKWCVAVDWTDPYSGSSLPGLCALRRLGVLLTAPHQHVDRDKTRVSVWQHCVGVVCVCAGYAKGVHDADGAVVQGRGRFT